MNTLDSLNSVLKDYDQNGFRVSVEVSQQEALKLFALGLGLAIAIALALHLLKGIFNS